MTHPISNQKRIQLAVGILSAAIIAFQLVLMHILSIVQWYHFAYMVISVALMGFGAAGTFLSIFRKGLLKNFEVVLPVLMIFSGTAMACVVRIAQLPYLRFDSYVLFADISHVWRLAGTCILFFIPFFSGALAIGLVFVKFAGSIGTFYFANLIGSGIGGIAVLGLLWLFLPHELPAIVSILPVLAGIIIISKQSRFYTITAALITVIIITQGIIRPSRLVLSEYKSVSKALNLPEAEISREESSPHGLLQVVTSPALRYAPGLSLNYHKAVPAIDGVFNNGNWFAPLYSWNRTDTTFILDYTTTALPYYMNDRNSVLILDAGTGMNAAHAIASGAHNVTVVEPNSTVLSLLENELAGAIDSLLYHPAVSVQNTASRTILLTDTTHYDLIAQPIIGEFGGSSGLYALQENYVLTKEAVREMWLRLTANGVIGFTSWMDYPVRKPLKLLATIVEVLREEGLENPANYIAGIRSWGTVTFVIKRTPVTADETRRIRDFCKRMYFDPFILPGITSDERTQFNDVQDMQFFQYTDEILSSEKINLYSDYDFNIRPATDNRPYFSQFIRRQSLPHLAEFFGNRTVPFFEIGYFIVVLTIVQIALAAVALIIVPLFSIGWKGGNKLRTLLYFGGIGLGYMFVEIIFIQRFNLYFGSPIYSAAATISFMLICSGVGSYVSSKLKVKGNTLLLLPGLIAGILLFYAMILMPVLLNTIAVPFAVKLFLAFIIIAPVSFFMGMPFPIGIGLLAQQHEKEIPWAWGINGCVSVLSAPLAVVTAVEMGFVWVMVFSALAYCLPLSMSVRIRRT